MDNEVEMTDLNTIGISFLFVVYLTKATKK